MSIYTEPRRCQGCQTDFIPKKPTPQSGRVVAPLTCSDKCRMKVAKRRKVSK